MLSKGQGYTFGQPMEEIYKPLYGVVHVSFTLVSFCTDFAARINLRLFYSACLGKLLYMPLTNYNLLLLRSWSGVHNLPRSHCYTPRLLSVGCYLFHHVAHVRNRQCCESL